MSLRSHLIRLAFTHPDLRRHTLSILATGEGEEETSSGGGVSGKFLQFLEEEGDKRLQNPDTGNNVKLKSLHGPKGKVHLQRVFQEWLKAQDKPSKKPKKEKAPEETKAPTKPEVEKPEPQETEPAIKTPTKGKFPPVDLKADRYKNKLTPELGVALNTKAVGKLQPGGPGTKAMVKKFNATKKLTPESLADTLGVPALAGVAGEGNYRMSVMNNGKGFDIQLRGPHIKSMYRKLATDDNGDLYIENEVLVLAPTAPKGLGTKIFATQVSQAREAGVSYIKCSAHRAPGDDSWVGYKVWPKMGYDGEIPEEAPTIPDSLKAKMEKAGFKEPHMVSHLYRVPGGEEWWAENGVSFDAKFDLAEDSLSMQVLGAYLAKKAEQEKTTPSDWISKTAKKNDKSKKDYENIDLDEADNKLLSEIWKKLSA